MAYKISRTCINCGGCEPECPFGAIEKHNHSRQIKIEDCKECGSCIASCPTDSIDS